MRAKAILCFTAILYAPAVHGQSAAEPFQDRVLFFKNTEAAQSFQEIATVIRSMTDIRQLSLDAAQRAVALHGTAAQVSLAEWLFDELDRSAVQRSPKPALREYRVAGSADDIVRVFYLNHAETARDVQEIATTIRAIANVPRLFIYNAPQAVAMRGTAGQAALAEWLIGELDRPVDRPPSAQDTAAPEFRLSGGSDDVVRVFYLARTSTAQQLQEVATRVRTTTGIRRLFTCTAPRALALRGTPEQVSSAGKLIQERNVRN